MMRRPFSPRNARASKARPLKPATRKTRETYRQVRSVASSLRVERGETAQEARIAQRNISVDHSVADHPMISESGDSLTIMMPIANSARVRAKMWRIIFQRASPLAKRAPSPKGMDMPTMNRKAGNTRSTNVMPLLP